MSNPLVIYHAGCIDGFCAAWIAHRSLCRSYERVELLPARYGTQAPTARDRSVYILDFSYPREEMERMARTASSVVVLDHHQTAEQELRSFSGATFDMNRSGAGMTWDHFHKKEPRPPIVNYVEDRDLWRFRLPSSQAVNAYIGTLPFALEAWDRAAEGWDQEQAVMGGSMVLAKIDRYVEEVARNAVTVKFEGYEVPMVNAPHVNISELLGYLAKGQPFSMGWSYGPAGYTYSLRADAASEVNVAALAKKHGGGGHPKSSGFAVKAPIRLMW